MNETISLARAHERVPAAESRVPSEGGKNKKGNEIKRKIRGRTSECGGKDGE